MPDNKGLKETLRDAIQGATKGAMKEAARLAHIAETIDLDQLEADGVIERQTGNWIKVLDSSRFPRELTSLGNAFETKDGEVIRFRLMSQKQREKLRRLVEDPKGD